MKIERNFLFLQQSILLILKILINISLNLNRLHKRLLVLVSSGCSINVNLVIGHHLYNNYGLFKDSIYDWLWRLLGHQLIHNCRSFFEYIEWSSVVTSILFRNFHLLFHGWKYLNEFLEKKVSKEEGKNFSFKL